jgi:signal transduction histidine kinase
VQNRYSVLRTPYSVLRAHHILQFPRRTSLLPPIRNLKLAVADTGPGITPEIRPHIFDPFFSGREAGRGLGLGLSKAWRIVREHGGTIEVESPSTGGAVFTIALPG